MCQKERQNDCAADIHGEQRSVDRRKQPRPKDKEAECDRDKHACEIAEKECLIVLYRRKIYALQPDARHLHEENIGQQFRRKSDRLIPKEEDSDDRSERERHRSDTKKGCGDIPMFPPVEQVGEIARDDHDKSAREDMRKYKGIDHGRGIELHFRLRHFECAEHHLYGKHHPCHQYKRSRRDDGRVAVCFHISGSRALPEQFF